MGLFQTPPQDEAENVDMVLLLVWSGKLRAECGWDLFQEGDWGTRS
jgi:hypothetical protein